MKAQDLIKTARALVADAKGLLAMAESTPTCNRRFAAQDIAAPLDDEGSMLLLLRMPSG